MQLMQPFDATKFDPTQTSGGLPVGKHPVVIKDSEIKPTKDNSAGMLVLELEIIDGPSKGVTGPYRLNLYNNNPQAVEIAHRQLSAICHVIGVYNVQDSQQLHGKPFVVEVGLQKDSEAAAKGYTEVKKVYDMNGNEPGKVAAGSGQPTNQAGNGGGAPWGGNQAPQQTNQAAPGGSGTPWGGSGGAQPGNSPGSQQNQPNTSPGWGGNAGNTAQQSNQTPPWGKR